MTAPAARRSALAWLVLAATVLSASAAHAACPPSMAATYCKAFKAYRTDNAPLDSRIADGLGVKDASQTRSIALIIAVDHYPNLPGADVPAAAVDAKRLTDFMINDQKFDEVIVLRDDEASKDAIDYFLTVYLPNRALDFAGKARLLIAYSGHGLPLTATTQPGFVLSGATSLTDDPGHIYNMESFGRGVQDLAPKFFHVLTLINACYGGNFFAMAVPGGDPNAWTAPGSYAITAGDKSTTVPSLDASRGSLFFDLLITGIQSGAADEEYFRYFATYGGDGQALSQDGLARTGQVQSYLSTLFAVINRDRAGKDPAFQPLSHPWIGPTERDQAAAGGFFFLASRPAAETQLAALPAAYTTVPRPGAAPTASFGISPPAAPPPPPPPRPAPEAAALPPGPISSVKGHPEIKVFKAPEIYPVFGYDLSSADGRIDWTKLAAGPKTRTPRFIYARAVGWAGVDATFRDRWSHAGTLGLDRGAYLKFDFCASPAVQLARLKKAAPPDPAMLPIAIELVTPQPDMDMNQTTCWRKLGAPAAQAAVLALAQAVEQAYGKTPLLSGNRYNLGVLTDARADRYMLWLQAYGSQDGAMKLSGRNPWSLWQYSGTVDAPGVGPKTTADVFFGDADAYAAFKRGAGNIGLLAAQ